MTALCLSVTEHLDFGALSMGYNGLWQNNSAPNVYALCADGAAEGGREDGHHEEQRRVPAAGGGGHGA